MNKAARAPMAPASVGVKYPPIMPPRTITIRESSHRQAFREARTSCMSNPLERGYPLFLEMT